MTDGPALAVLELGSIARGFVCLDAAVKRAPVSVLVAEPVTPGKFWLALRGGEAEIEEALTAAVDRAGDSRIDHVLLPYAHPSLMASVLRNGGWESPDDAMGTLELGSISATVRATDAALKCAAVRLVALGIARGIGGKGYCVLTGDLADVEAAMEEGLRAAGEAWLVGREVIPRPDAATSAAVRGR